MNVIKREENLSRVKLTQCLGGIPQEENKRYKDMNEQIMNIVDDYPGTPILDYLRYIAYKLLQK